MRYPFFFLGTSSKQFECVFGLRDYLLYWPADEQVSVYPSQASLVAICRPRMNESFAGLGEKSESGTCCDQFTPSSTPLPRTTFLDKQWTNLYSVDAEQLANKMLNYSSAVTEQAQPNYHHFHQRFHRLVARLALLMSWIPTLPQSIAWSNLWDVPLSPFATHSV